MIASVPNQCNWGIKPLDNLEITWEQKHTHYVLCRKILDVNMSITLYWIMKTYDEILGTEECKKDRERRAIWAQTFTKYYIKLTDDWREISCMKEFRYVKFINSFSQLRRYLFSNLYSKTLS